jgi:hypothetical protein
MTGETERPCILAKGHRAVGSGRLAEATETTRDLDGGGGRGGRRSDESRGGDGAGQSEGDQQGDDFCDVLHGVSPKFVEGCSALMYQVWRT